MRRGSRGFARARGEGNDAVAVKLVASFSGVAMRKRTGSEYNITSHVFPCICTYIHKKHILIYMYIFIYLYLCTHIRYIYIYICISFIRYHCFDTCLEALVHTAFILH